MKEAGIPECETVEAGGLSRRIGRNSAAQLASLSISVTERVVVTGLLIRAWGPETYGAWAVVFSAACLLLIGELGSGIHLGNLASRGDTRVGRLAVSLGLAQFVLLFGLGAAMVGLGFPAGPEGALPFTILAAAMALLAARSGLSQIYRGRGRFARGALIEAIPTLASVLGTAAVALAGGSMVALATVHLVSQAVFGWGMTVLDLSRSFPGLALRPVLPRKEEVSAFLRDIRWLALQQNMPLVWAQAPLLVMAGLGLPAAALAGFVLVRTLCGLVRQIGTALCMAAGAELARGLGGTADQTHLVSAGRLLGALAAALGVGVIVFGRDLTGLWTGKPDLFDLSAAGWLVAGGVMAAPGAPLLHALLYGGHARPVAETLLLQAAVGLTAAAMLAPTFGTAGAAAGLALGEALALAWVLPRLGARALGVALPALWREAMPSIAASAAWSAAVGLAVSAAIETATPWGLLAGMAVWGTIGILPPLLSALPGASRERLLNCAGLFRSGSESVRS